MNKALIGGLVGGFAGGLVAGYFIGKRHADRIFIPAEGPEQLSFNFDAKEEAHKIAENVKEIIKDQKYAFPDEETEMAYFEAMNAHPSNQEPEEDGDAGEVVSIFSRIPDEDKWNYENWDYEKEITSREGKDIYIIHQDEFFQDEMDWDDQHTYTYYEGDDVLCTEDDVPIPNFRTIVCEMNFGHGSNDLNTVYIRNHTLQNEFEIIRDPGSYEHTVLGGKIAEEMEAEDLRHSRHPGKFRLAD